MWWNLALLAQGRHSEVPVQGGPAGTDRAPQGWYRDRPADPFARATPDHPLQALQAFRGPLRCLGYLSPSKACWVGSTPV